MTQFSVTVDGTPVDGVISVNFGGEGTGLLASAEVEAENTDTNLGFGYGDEVVIKRSGVEEFRGRLSGKPSIGDRNLKVLLRARDEREVLKDEEAHRVIYDRDSGQAIREAATQRSKPRDPTDIFVADDLSGWDGSAVDVFELAGLSEQSLANRGTDLVYLHFGAGSTGDFSVTYSGVPGAISDGRLLWLETRTMFNNAGDFFTVEVELRDNSGYSYVWDLPTSAGSQPTKERLLAEEARTDGTLSTDGTVEYRITIDGQLPEARAGVLDYARARPFALEPRGNGLDVSGVQDSGRRITRRVDSSILTLISTLAEEEGATSRIEEDRLIYESAGNTATTVEIQSGQTPVVGVDVRRANADIANKITAQGAGDLQKQYKSPSSIQFYGEVPKEDTIVNDNIQSEAELDEWAEGYLQTHAWDDTAAEFTVADSAFRDVKVGQSIPVEWTPDDIGPAEFIVSSTETDDVGRVTIGITGQTG